MDANRILSDLNLTTQLIEQGSIIDAKFKEGKITTEEYRKLSNELIDNFKKLYKK